jgi:hypothetical protein
VNFAAALKRLEADLDPDAAHDVPWPTHRPTVHQPLPQTDGLDPAAPGGPSPLNSGQGPYGEPVASDPLMAAPMRPGSPIPHVQGPDEDTTTLT